MAWVVRRMPAELRSWDNGMLVRVQMDGKRACTGCAEKSDKSWVKTLAQTVAVSCGEVR